MFKHVAFVRAVGQQEHVVVAPPLSKELNGESARKFYDEVVSQPSTFVDAEPVTATGAGRDRGSQASLCQPVKRVQVSEYFTAAQRNDIAQLERCLRTGIGVDVTDIFGWTALMCAACDGAADSVRYLLQNGASRCLANTQGKTAVELAAQHGRVEVVELLRKPEKLGNTVTAQSGAERQADDSRRDPTQLCRVCDMHISFSRQNSHEASILHQFNMSRDRAPGVTHYGISESNTGFQMLLGMGWDRNKGFGPREQGRKFPVKTVLRRNRAGLGAEVSTPRVTHFAPNDTAAVENWSCHGGGKAASLKRKREEQESHSQRMKRMEIEFRRSFY